MPALPDTPTLSGSIVERKPTAIADAIVRPVRVEVCSNPFTTNRVTHLVESPASLTSLLQTIELPYRPSVRYVVSIDGLPIPESDWDWLAPEPHSVVTVRAVPRGGDGKNIGLLIVGVLILTGAAILAATPGGQGAAGIFAKFGVALILIGTVGLIAPSPQRPPSRQEDNLVATITGTRNQANPYGAIPRILGYHRVYPPLGAVPYTELFNNDQYLRMLFVVGYGPLQLSDIKIGSTPIDNYEDVEYDVLEGRVGDPQPAYYTKDVREETFDILLSSADSWHRRTTAPETHEIIVDIVAPIGLVAVTSKGKREPVTVTFEVRYSVAGAESWATFAPFTIHGKDAGILRKSVRIEAAGLQYDVEVRKTSADNTDPQVVDEIRWTVLRSVSINNPVATDKKLAMISLRIRASNQLNGVIDQLNCLAKSYLQVYNGASWVEQVSNNPAWCFTSVFTDQANPSAMSTTRLDVDTIKSWADWCEIGQYFYNKPVDQKTTVFALVREIAAAGRASFAMKDSLYSVTRDIAQTVPVQHITPRNSWDYSGDKFFIDQIHAFRAEFLNEDSDYQPDEIFVYADGYAAHNATNIEKLQFVGVTKDQQVWRLSRYHLAQLLLRPEVHSLMMDIESLVSRRGDLVEMVHDVPKFGLGCGRITDVTLSSGAATEIAFDEFWIHDAAKSYAIRVRKASGDSLLIPVDTAAGENESVVFTTPIAEGELQPEVGDLVLFGELVGTTVRMLIKSIIPQTDLTARIELVDEAPGVLTADTSSIPPFDPHITQPPSLESLVPPTPSIINIISDETIMDRGPDGSLTTRVSLSLFIPANSRRISSYYFQVQWRAITGSGVWIMSPLIPVDQGRVLVDQVEDGEIYEFRARTTNGAGLHSPWTPSIAHTVVGKTTVPPDISSVFVEQQSDGTRVFTWELLDPPPDIDGFLLRYKIGPSGTWTDSKPLHTGVLKSSPFETNQLAAGQYTFLIKAVDTAGNESANPKVIISTLGDPRLAGALIQVNCRAEDWPGTVNLGIKDPTGDLIATGQKTWADFAIDGITWGDWDDWNRLPVVFVVYTHTIIDLGAIIRFTPIVSAVGTGTPTIYEQHSDDGISFTELLEITGPITARYLGIQLVMASSSPAPLIENLFIIADAQALVEDQADVDTTTLSGSVGDRRLSLTKTFTVITSVAIALQNVGPGWSWEIVDKDAALGPRIRIYNNTATLADAIIDVVVRGLA